MTNSYWTGVSARRLSRRRALAITGGTVFGATLLAACGGGQDPVGDASGLLSRLEDTSNRAVSGGNRQLQQSNDQATMDANLSRGTTNLAVIEPVYQHFLGYGPAIGKRGPIVGDAAESWEISPDGLTLTFKLKENKFDPRPPTNGRSMDTNDVRFSWDRTEAASPFAGDWLHSVSPSSPVLSLATPDARTAVVKLAFPYLSTLDMFVKDTYFSIMPVEAEDKFDSKSEARGSGPFLLDNYQASLAWTYSKNPNWIEKGLPYLDGMVETIIPEYVAALTQFEAGRLWDFPVRQQDILRVKRDHPELVMLQEQPTGADPAPGYTILSQQPDSPLRDERIRRAASMLADRKLAIATMYNTDSFQAAGLNVETRWHSHIGADCAEWLDPQGTELGEGAKYFQFNPTEAKKLIAAAGYGGKPLSWWWPSQYHDSDPRNAIASGMVAEGFNLDLKGLEYPRVWRETCQLSAGQNFSGFCENHTTGFNAENYVTSVFTPEGKFRYAAEAVYPTLTDLARKIKVELDPERQVEMIKQLQREAAVIMPFINGYDPGIAFGFTLNQPWLKNFGVFNATRPYVYYWYDKTKDPKARSS